MRSIPAQNTLDRIAVFACLALAVTVGSAFGEPEDAADEGPSLAGLTLVVYHQDMPDSEALAREYAGARGIGESQLIGLSPPRKATVTREEFNDTLRDPLRAVMTERGFWRVEPSPNGPVVTAMQPRFIALMHGIPRRIAPQQQAVAPGQEDAASVDSELAVLALTDAPAAGALRNPYFGRDHPASELEAPLLLVARLDAPSINTARRMLADSLAVERNGAQGFAYVDFARRRGGYVQGERWLEQAEESLWRAGIPVVAERHNTLWLREYPMERALIYLGWYAEHVTGPFTSGAFRFQQGAVAVHLHSFSAAEIAPARHWVGPLLEGGAAASLGNMFEPYLGLTTHLDVFTERLLAGYTLAEAAWMATPALSWMTVVHGDPLYRPFARRKQDDGTETRLEPGSPAAWLAHQWNDEVPTATSVARVKQQANEQDDAWLLEATGLAWHRLGEEEKAINAFRRAAELSDTCRTRLRLLLHEAEVLRAQGRLEKTIALLRQRAGSFEDEGAREALGAVLLQIDPPAP